MKLEELFYSSLKQRDKNQLKKIFKKNLTIDLAEIANNYNNKEDLVFIFQNIDPYISSDFFSKLNIKTQETLIKILDDKEINKIIDHIYSDDIINILKELPLILHKKILKNCHKEKYNNIRKLLNYKKNSAASLITTEYIELSEDTLTSEALNVIRQYGKNAATIYTIFLKNKNNEISGVCELNKILFSENNEKLSSIKENNFIYVNKDTDQEEVAKKIKKYNLNVIPVINNKKLIGIITVDDIIDIIEEEVSEDIELQAGIIPLKDDFCDITSFKMAINYSPWLIILIVASIFSSALLSVYEEKLKNFIFLAAFIPVILDTCGNAGGQTCSVVIRSLAINDRLINKKNFLFFFIKELKTSFLTALFVSFISFFIFSMEIKFGLINNDGFNAFRISAIASLSLFISLFFSKILGFIMPIVSKKMKKDPALMSEPIVTTIADFLGILCYFKIASFFLNF